MNNPYRSPTEVGLPGEKEPETRDDRVMEYARSIIQIAKNGADSHGTTSTAMAYVILAVRELVYEHADHARVVAVSQEENRQKQHREILERLDKTNELLETIARHETPITRTIR